MSEYQYYEFVAIDQPLTPTQLAELRARSSRATITPTCFVNDYQWGNLKGDPADWMRRYFDAHVYVANWNACQLLLRVPRFAFDTAAQQSLVEFLEIDRDLLTAAGLADQQAIFVDANGDADLEAWIADLQELAQSAAETRKQQEAVQRRQAEVERQAKREAYLHTLAVRMARGNSRSRFSICRCPIPCRLARSGSMLTVAGIAHRSLP